MKLKWAKRQGWEIQRFSETGKVVELKKKNERVAGAQLQQ